MDQKLNEVRLADGGEDKCYKNLFNVWDLYFGACKSDTENIHYWFMVLNFLLVRGF